MLPVVSVIMPWHNTPLVYVQAAVMSVLQQDYEGKIELVICDDGSLLALSRQLESLVSRFDWGDVELKLCRNGKRQGIAEARNAAVSMASGDWLIWLDADDALAAGAVRGMLSKAFSAKAGLVVSNCLVLQGKQKYVREPQIYLSLGHRYQGTPVDPLATVVFSLQAQLVQTGLFTKIGGFDPSYGWAEVTDFFLRFVSTYGLDTVTVLPEIMYMYNRRANSHSGQRRELFAQRRRALLAYAERQGLSVADLQYLGRCLSTGAQHYAAIVNGLQVWPPYIQSSSGPPVQLELVSI